MTFDPAKGHAALRHGRFSAAGADYFVTFCTIGRRPGLEGALIAEGIFHEIRSMEADGAWTIRCATIMPDHVHLFLVLGARLTLGRSVQRLKSKTAALLRAAGLVWENNFFDRRLRQGEDSLPLFLYVYLNPYRKNLLTGDRQWPWYFCRQEEWVWLRDKLEEDLPPPEWLR